MSTLMALPVTNHAQDRCDRAAAAGPTRRSHLRGVVLVQLDLHAIANRGLRTGWIFDSLLEAQFLIEDWRVDYNTNRPHNAHGDLTPSVFALAWTTRNQPALA